MRVSKGGERQSEEELIFKEIAVDSFSGTDEIFQTQDTNIPKNPKHNK